MKYEEAFEICKRKLEINMREIPKDNPEFCACGDGCYFKNEKPIKFMEIQVWMPSFFMGEALLAYEQCKDEKYLKWLEGFAGVYHDKVFRNEENTMHDLGFLYTLYAVGLYQLTGKIQYKEMAVKAADELCKRFSIKGGYIRAWGRKDDMSDRHAGEAIIDCMMNIPLLFWAYEETGIPFYHEIAMKHADTTLQYFLRPDGSVYHAYRFDIATGKPLWGCNYCGYADESFWARGCAWAIYGFTVAYKYTKRSRYLDTAERLANRFMEEIEKRGGEKIPVWDFRLPENLSQEKDSSAAAIAASAFYELAAYIGQDKYFNWSKMILDTLLEPAYFDVRKNIPGMLKESNGLKHYTLFGDYFFMEALLKHMVGWKMYW